jgi:chromosomal replication initiator protein
MMNQMADELPTDEYHRWMGPARFHSAEENKIKIAVPNIFFRNWIEDRYLPKMKRILSEISQPAMELELVSEPPDGLDKMEEKTVLPAEAGPDAWTLPPLQSKLNDKYTFENFVVGSSNQLAHAASLAVAHRTASYNPLFIYGGSGLGKTHLLNSVGNYALSQDRNTRVAYLSSEDFTNELIEALRNEGMSGFRQKYRNIDILLIDDIHFIGGRERTQEEFFYTFNALYEADKQIVLSSDKMPKEIPDLEERLRSRFEGGLFADITPPDRETKVAILTRKAKEEGIELSVDVAFYLASQNETNIRVLEGYLARLGTYSSLTNTPIDLDVAKRLLGLFIEDERKNITLDIILKASADFFHIKVSDLKSNKKQKAVAAPRQAAMYLARQLTGLSTIEIGHQFGGRDHSTVIHAVKRVETRLEEDHNYARSLSELERIVRENASSIK